MSKIFKSIKISKEVKKEIDQVFDALSYCHKYSQTQEIERPCSQQCERCEFITKNKY